MSRQILRISMFMLTAIPANIFTMRSATTKLPISVTNTQFANNSQQPTPKTTVQIPVEQSNQSLAKVVQEQQNQNSSNQSKWYQNKKLKYFTGLGAGAAINISTRELEKKTAQPSNMFPDENIQKEDLKSEQRFLNSDPAEIAAPHLHTLFLKIKERLKITENIQLRIEQVHDNFSLNADATYLPQYNCIIINADYSSWNAFQIIRVLVHELEHVKQIHHYPDSYKLSSL